ncbi:GNAT family N-acetyltransferase [Stenotrophomonas maltophilia]|uniref:GNAT family N-acetyltransferase n=1 Tax=Stenotrophomonas maltophilia TaxID=40324 RepID=UPI00255632D5|nr:GNAT family N-acetyltransferase [Stenotrophomonas maltophilia]
MVLIRAFNEDDREALRQIYTASRGTVSQSHVTREPPGYEFDQDTLGECVYVALLDGVLAGFISIWLPDSFVHHLYVAPHLQRRGIGAALLHHGLRHCKASVAATPSLKCLQSNAAALAFYQRQGWDRAGQGCSTDGDYWLMRPIVP